MHEIWWHSGMFMIFAVYNNLFTTHTTQNSILEGKKLPLSMCIKVCKSETKWPMTSSMATCAVTDCNLPKNRAMYSKSHRRHLSNIQLMTINTHRNMKHIGRGARNYTLNSIRLVGSAFLEIHSYSRTLHPTANRCYITRIIKRTDLLNPIRTPYCADVAREWNWYPHRA